MNKTKSFNIKDFIFNNAIVFILLILVLFVGIMKDNFFSIGNFNNVSTNVAVRFIIALGVSGCLITKGTDLSAGRMVGLGACVAGTMLQKATYSGKFFPNMGEVNIILALLITIAVCAVFGILNGVVIAYFKVPPFIATLGMQQIVYGICLVYTGAEPLGGYTKQYTNVATGKIGVPYLFYIALAIGLVMWFLYNKMRHGKFMYAIGGNESAAEVSGVNVKKTIILIYLLAACLYAVGGFLTGAKAAGATVNTGLSYELEAIAACTIGGVSTNGGVGKISGIFIGVLVFELLKVSLQFLGVDPSYQYIVQGLVIIVAVALDLRKYLAKK